MQEYMQNMTKKYAEYEGKKCTFIAEQYEKYDEKICSNMPNMQFGIL